MLAPQDYWQELLPRAGSDAGVVTGSSYLATLPDGRRLVLPIRERPDGRHGLASLIVNQASFAVLDALATALAESLRAAEIERIVGLPTLGLTLASAVAQKLGHQRYLPCGTSKKFWYDEALSAPISSVTTATERRLYLDPRLLPLLEGHRVALIDDVISTGRSISAGLDLLNRCGCQPAAIGCAMLQTDAWREVDTLRAARETLHFVFSTPLLVREGERWTPV